MKVQQKLAIGFIRTKINLVGIFSKRKAAMETFRVFCTPIASPVKEKDIFRDAEALELILNDKPVRGFRFNHPKEHKVLLLHGFSSSAQNFDRYVTALLKKNYEVLVFDAPAHGKSEGKMVNAIGYSEMIQKANEQYGPVKGYVAHSFGGIALAIAMENISHDQATKIVFIAPATETTSAIDHAFKTLGLKSKQLRSEFERIIYEKSGKESSWFSIRRAMNNIKASVLWIHDEDDDTTPLEDALMVKEDRHPNTRFMITKGLGHNKIYRDEKVINEAVKFL